MAEKSRYDDFDIFLKDVVETAKTRSDVLKQIYDISNMHILIIIIWILSVAGFSVLTALTASLVLGWLGFVIEIPILLGNPVGWAILGIFGSATVSTLWKIYRDRKIVMAVSNLGKRVKPSWKLLLRTQAKREDFDRLHKEAVTALLISPAEFYRAIRKPEEIEKMFQDFMNFKR